MNLIRYKARIKFDGSNYAGWQVQPGLHTVQGDLEEILSVIFGEKIGVTGCGRTDAGVHASDFMIHFDLPSDRYDPGELAYKLNNMSSPQIAVQSVVLAPGFHARFDALTRKYCYTIHFDKDPFMHRYSFLYAPFKNIDKDVLHSVALKFLEYKDFATFCKSKTDVRTTLCEMNESRWDFTDMEKAVFHVRANRFLRGMVRMMVGASILIGEGKLSVEALVQSLEAKERLPKDWSVPPQGLNLVEVLYPD